MINSTNKNITNIININHKNKNINTPSINKQNKLIQFTALPKDLKILITQPNYLNFLAGFFEGEGTLCISIKLSKTAKFGIQLDPSFGVYQHVKGIRLLQSFWVLFEGKGSLHPKQGSPLVWTYELKSVSNLIYYVLPFMLYHVLPFSCKTQEFLNFQHIVLAMERKDHWNKELLKDLVRKAYSYTGKGNNRKRTLDEVLLIIEDKDAYFDKVKILENEEI